MCCDLKALPHEVTSLQNSFSALGFSGYKPLVLALAAYYRDKFLLDSIPKEWLAQDRAFCSMLIHLIPASASICVALQEPLSKKEFIRRISKDYRYAAVAHIDLIRDAALMCYASALVDGRVMGFIDPEAHQDPRIPSIVDHLCEVIQKRAGAEEADKRSTDIRMLLAYGNGWAHPSEGTEQYSSARLAQLHNSERGKSLIRRGDIS